MLLTLNLVPFETVSNTIKFVDVCGTSSGSFGAFAISEDGRLYGHSELNGLEELDNESNWEQLSGGVFGSGYGIKSGKLYKINYRANVHSDITLIDDQGSWHSIFGHPANQTGGYGIRDGKLFLIKEGKIPGRSIFQVLPYSNFEFLGIIREGYTAIAVRRISED